MKARNPIPARRPAGISLLMALLFAAFAACRQGNSAAHSPTETPDSMHYAQDPHSYARPQEARVTHLNLDIDVDFSQKRIRGIASWDIETTAGARSLILDTRGLEIQSVTDGAGQPLKFTLGTPQKWLGAPLEIELGAGTKQVRVHYQTGAGADALQWLDPVQTAGKQHPFLFTQSQAILARTWIPCQDSPGIRFTYAAQVTVPQGLLALMSATNPQAVHADGKYSFEMKQRIPSYLMALTVGDLQYKPVGKRTGVYAEPVDLERSAWEFAEMEDMLVAAEELYGPYRWEMYDLIVLPPSFPFGGMENPRLTFATPTILAGDRSLTSLVAHELAHSWSGNLVTNATWNDFWLNEGFTVYFERRIMEKIAGKDYADMLAVLGYQDLLGTVASMGDTNPDTQLKLNLAGRDADDGMNDIAYEKGNLMLCNIEHLVGRARWDQFLREYFDAHAFQVMTTEEFIVYIRKHLLDAPEFAGKFDLDTWIYKPGLPAHIAPHSSRLEKADSTAAAFAGGAAAASLTTQGWTTHEWQRFLRALPEKLSQAQLRELDAQFGFTRSGNSEIKCEWFFHTIAGHYTPADEALEAFLLTVGRRKFVKPLFQELTATPEGTARAKAIYARSRANYHAVTQYTIDEMLGWQKGPEH